MPTKVLVFESDPKFAGELRDEFNKLGCSTTVVEDGNLGLQHAATEKPDLILLSIELPRMNGFSVCNKLKKDPHLKEVPLIIMSSESSDETFEQHKKLRTRAEDYVHKPIPFRQLLGHIHAFVPLAGVGSDSDSAIVIDDEIEIGATDLVSDDVDADAAHGAASPESTARNIETVDADVEAIAESAFGRITVADAAEVQATRNGVPTDGAPMGVAGAGSAYVMKATQVGSNLAADSVAARSASVRPATSGARTVEWAEYERVRDELARVKERFDDVDRAFEETRAELEKRRMEAAEAGRLAREVEELKAKIASGAKGAAASSREFLDLREALNRKDKEILGLKELGSKKDKQIVEAQDRALALERAHADLEEKLLSVERELNDTRERGESLAADRDLAKKASEDFRTRLEKLRADNEAKEKQVGELKGRHADELMAAEERRREDLGRLQQEHVNELSAAQARSQGELEHAKAEAAQHERAALEELRRELEAVAAHEFQQASGKAAKLEQELASGQALLAELSRVRDELESKLNASEGRVASMEGEVTEARQMLLETRQRLMGESARADKIQVKVLADRQSLERAKDALAVALAQIEEAQERQP